MGAVRTSTDFFELSYQRRLNWNSPPSPEWMTSLGQRSIRLRSCMNSDSVGVPNSTRHQMENRCWNLWTLQYREGGGDTRLKNSLLR